MIFLHDQCTDVYTCFPLLSNNLPFFEFPAFLGQIPSEEKGANDNSNDGALCANLLMCSRFSSSLKTTAIVLTPVSPAWVITVRC